jgi:hypothetical protein
MPAGFSTVGSMAKQKSSFEAIAENTRLYDRNPNNQSAGRRMPALFISA